MPNAECQMPNAAVNGRTIAEIALAAGKPRRRFCINEDGLACLAVKLSRP
jgi:hypothetical protein